MLTRLKIIREPAGEYAPARPIRTAQDAFNMLRDYFAPLDREHLVALCLDQKNRPIGYHTLSQGTLNATLGHPREVFKVAILSNAASVILCHNHPSGDPAPSSDDVVMWRRMDRAGELMGIRILDSIVFGAVAFCSIRDAEEARP